MANIFSILFSRQAHVCPRWCCFTFDNALRRLFQDPQKILEGLVKPGDTVADIGPGQGYFTIPLADMVGGNGMVYAVDLQREMLDAVTRKARQHGLERRIEPVLASPTSLNLAQPVDFALAFWMVHEVPDAAHFLAEVRAALKSGGRLLVVEPLGHVGRKQFERTVAQALNAGYSLISRPSIAFSRAVLLSK